MKRRGGSLPSGDMEQPVSKRKQDLAALDFAHVWHPFTQGRTWRERAPTIIERAEGFELIDTEGRRYIDGFSSLWCNVHGHQRPEIDEAIRAQLGRVAHSTLLGLGNVPSIELATRLVETVNRRGIAPRLEKVFYSDAGATAVEVAFKMAVGHHFHRGETGRDTIVGLGGAYHGDTVGAMSVGYVETFHRPFRRMTFRCAWAQAPDVCRTGTATGAGGEWPSWDAARRERVRDTALADLDRVLEEVGERCAAVAIEPLMQGAAGMIEQPEGYLASVLERVRERGLLLIADEVAVGLGRTGEFVACHAEGAQPDILCLAKGLSGGYLPLAATLCTEEIAESFEGEPHEHRTLYHGHTYTGNPLACAAALASLEIIEREDIPANARRNGERIGQALRDALRDHPHVGDVRRRGVMAGIELVRAREPWTPFDERARVGAAFCFAARERGLMIRPLGDVVILTPAPGMDEATLGRMLGILFETFESFDFEGEEERLVAGAGV